MVEVDALNRRLVALIRSGVFEDSGEARTRLYAHLVATTRAKLAASNPKYLVAGERA